MSGLWPAEYLWMLEAAALKDGVTAFEVYMESALQETFEHLRFGPEGQRMRLRLKTNKNQESPPWSLLACAHKILGTTVDTNGVEEIRALRHLLTHQRGELRHEQSWRRFRDESLEATMQDYERSYVGGKVMLGEARVLRLLDELGAVVREADRPVWALRWNKGTLPAEELYRAKCVELVPAD
ncbi:hypothetical protein [Streptomyces sp. HPF1205]|uniref:hypothetical protein n=1 Tax=Streptomyces sp. HPF1205 TaxID=2873262 RepID=UPI001CED2F5C|nr:hypothetical protein [Streptomyces sp. HPF1205]